MPDNQFLNHRNSPYGMKTSEMRRFLFLALNAGPLSPSAAKAESHWLILSWHGGKSSVMQKVEMPSAEACEKEGSGPPNT